MSFYIMVIIMVVAGLLGGGINYVLQQYRDDTPKPPQRPLSQSLLLGIGATLLVPLFLKIADSKLLDNIHFCFSYNNCAVDTTFRQGILTTDTLVIKLQADSAKTVSYKLGNAAKANTQKKETSSAHPEEEAGKNYFLWMAYCLLASCAGFRFINMLINNFVTDEKLKQVTAKNQELETKADVKKKIDEKEAIKAEQKANEYLVQNTIQQHLMIADEFAKVPLIPQLPPIKYTDDPQKGRFGGQSQINSRILRASVLPTNDKFFYNVTIWVESTDLVNHPLEGDVIFYLHHSFHPSVVIVPVIEGKATYTKEAYGAFTVGAIADLGQTLLELDLALDRSFPADFRSR